MGFDTGHALLIGIGTYAKAPQLNVKMTATDAAEIARVVRDPASCGYPPAQVTLLQNEQTTREGILQGLDALATNTQSDDTVLIFYSGHGDFGTDERTYYLTTHDTEITDDGRVKDGTGITLQELIERLRMIKAKRALLIFNACHAGTISPQSLGAQPAAVEATVIGQALPSAATSALLDTGEGRVLIAGCRERQRSWYLETEPTTVFGRVLAEALQGKGVQSQDGVIGVFELYLAVYHGVKQEVWQRWTLEQEPELTIQRGIGEMAVALYQQVIPPGAPSTPRQPASLDGTAVREVRPEDSRRLREQIMNGEIDLAAGRDIRNNTFVRRDQVNIGRDQVQIHAQESRGFNYQPGTVTQHFGPQHNIDTGGGSYAERDINQQKGIFGGTFHGSATGNVEGNQYNTYGSAPSAPPAASLEHVRTMIKNAAEQATAAGNEDLADSLQRVELDLKAVLRAEKNGETAKRQKSLQTARQSLAALVQQTPSLQQAIDMLGRIS